MYKNGTAQIRQDITDHYLSQRMKELEARHLKTKLDKEAYIEMKAEE